MDPSEIYEKKYLPGIVKWGKLTCWLSIPIILLPVLVLVLVFGARAPLEAATSGIIAILSASFAMYFADPLAVFPVLGTPGLYLTYLSGNSKQIRVPASLMAQDAAGVTPGSPQGNVLSCIGVAVSVLISTLVMTVMVLLGDAIITVLPAPILRALPTLLPALFAALLVQQMMAHPKVGLIALALAVIVRGLDLAGVFQFLPLGGGYAPMLLCVFGTILMSRLLFREKRAEADGKGSKNDGK